MLTAEGCRARQERLVAKIAENGWDVFITTNFRTVYYFTGQLAAVDAPCAFVAWPNGQTELIAPAVDAGLAAGKHVIPVYSPEVSVELPHGDLAPLLQKLTSGGVNIAVDRTSTASSALLGNAAHDASRTVLGLRRYKHPDEIAEIQYSLDLITIAYDTAKRTIRPGITELDVFLEMSAAIARHAGAPVPFPGDFACGLRSVRGGGAATKRLLQEGDLFPLDLFPAPALYAGDTCRTFCVGEPSPRQVESWKLVCDALSFGETLLRPGVKARDVYQPIKDMLDAAPITNKSFWHHAGHGIGLHGHEGPRFIPKSEDVLEPGDVVTLEPGVYVDENQGGIRIENNFIITETGAIKIFDYPLGL